MLICVAGSVCVHTWCIGVRVLAGSTASQLRSRLDAGAWICISLTSVRLLDLAICNLDEYVQQELQQTQDILRHSPLDYYQAC